LANNIGIGSLFSKPRLGRKKINREMALSIYEVNICF